jgi:hypothetical protein
LYADSLFIRDDFVSTGVTVVPDALGPVLTLRPSLDIAPVALALAPVALTLAPVALALAPVALALAPVALGLAPVALGLLL